MGGRPAPRSPCPRTGLLHVGPVPSLALRNGIVHDILIEKSQEERTVIARSVYQRGANP